MKPGFPRAAPCRAGAQTQTFLQEGRVNPSLLCSAIVFMKLQQPGIFETPTTLLHVSSIGQKDRKVEGRQK